MAYSIGPKISLDGEADFREATRQSAAALKTLDAEFAAVKASAENGEDGLSALTEEYEILRQKNEILHNSLELTAKELDRVSDEQGENSESALKLRKNYANLYVELSKNEQALSQAEKKLNANTQEGNGLKSALSALIEKLKGTKSETDEVAESLDNANSSADRFGKNGSSAMDMLKKAVQAIALKKLVTEFQELMLNTAQLVDSLNTLSATTGLATDELQKLEYASKFVDVSVDTMSKTMREIGKKMGEAKAGSTEAAQAFEALGVSLYSGVGELRDSKEVWEEVLRKLGNVSNETERTNLAMKLMGEEATALNGIMGDAGVAALKGYSDEAERMGLVMSNDTLQKLQGLNDANDRLKSKFEAVKNEIAAQLAPKLTELADKMSLVMEAAAPLISDALGWILDHIGEIGNGIKYAAIGFAAWKIISSIVPMLSSFNGTLATTNATMLSNPAIYVAGLIAAAATAFGVALGKWADTAGKAVDVIGNAGNNIKEGAEGAVKAVDDFNGGLSAIVAMLDWDGLRAGLSEKFSMLGKNSANAYTSSIKEHLGNIQELLEVSGIGSSGITGGNGFVTDLVNGMKSVFSNAQATASGTAQTFTINLIMDGRTIAQVLWDPLNDVAIQKGSPIINEYAQA